MTTVREAEVVGRPGGPQGPFGSHELPNVSALTRRVGVSGGFVSEQQGIVPLLFHRFTRGGDGAAAIGERNSYAQTGPELADARCEANPRCDG